jgi:topoisomerase-4 subunit B
MHAPLPDRPWGSTTHDWASTVDTAHLDDVRARAGELAGGGAPHLLLEVLAYADDEAESVGRTGHVVVTLHPDGSVSVADDGRGTDTRTDASGRIVRKPVMATRDLRFFDADDAPPLPDGRPRRGMSVVAALSTTLVHTNRRLEGAWTQTYAHGVPTGGLDPVDADGTTGTTVRFLPDPALVAPARLRLDAEAQRLVTSWPHLHVHLARIARDTYGPRPQTGG